jgi:secondary thiamine-phosphate synthase enzyme
MRVCRVDLCYLARRSPEFIDITCDVEEAVRESGIRDGLAVVASQHTTAAIVVQENEPLLLQDLCDMLERIAPRDMYYGHDDFDIRVVNMHPNEPANGYAHCRHALLGGSKSIPVNNGRLALGEWGRVFLVELDAPRERNVQVQIIGA